MMHCIFDILNVLFREGGREGEGGGHTKEYSVYTFDNVDSSGQP